MMCFEIWVDMMGVTKGSCIQLEVLSGFSVQMLCYRGPTLYQTSLGCCFELGDSRVDFPAIQPSPDR